MKNKQNFAINLWLIAAVFTAVLISSCAAFNKASVGYVNNRQSVAKGQSVDVKVGGKELTVSVSSTHDGSGPVASGTYISNNNRLTVDANETANVLFVIAYSAKEGNTATKEFRVVTVTSVNATPNNGIAVAGRTLQFSAQVSGTNNPETNVTWKVGPNNDGSGTVTQGTSVNSNGVLTVSTNETPKVLYVSATSAVDPTKSSVVSVNIVVPTVTRVVITPAEPTLQKGETFQFSAKVEGQYEPSQTVRWTVSSNAAGTGAVTSGTSIDANGLLSIAFGEAASTLFITATSTYDTTKSARVMSMEIKAPNRIHPSQLVGTWVYHYEMIQDSKKFVNSVTMVLKSDGTGTKFTLYGTEPDVNRTDYNITSWTINELNQIVYTQVTKNNDGVPFSQTITNMIKLSGNKLNLSRTDYQNIGTEYTRQ